MSQGEKNVQSDRDSNPEPSKYRTATLPTELAFRLHILSQKSEQFWTVTLLYKKLSDVVAVSFG
jgi:hypothetical protein